MLTGKAQHRMAQFEQKPVLAVMTILVALFAFMFARDLQERALVADRLDLHRGSFSSGALTQTIGVPEVSCRTVWFTLLVATASFFLSITDVRAGARSSSGS